MFTPLVPGALPLLTGPGGSMLYPAGARIGPRELRDFELVLLVTGSAVLSVAEPGKPGQEHVLQPGAVALLRPGQRDSWAWSREGTSRHLFVHFDVDPVPAGVGGWPIVRHWPPSPAVSAAFRQITWLGSHRPDAADVARRWVGALLASVLADAVEVAGSTPPAGALAAVLAYVRDRWRAEGLLAISRTELASAAGTSVGHVARAFRAEYGAGPAQALEWVRLLQALPLLERSALPLADVARVCGFADAYHFSHRFRSRLGVAPSTWRRAPGNPQPSPGIARLERLLVADEPG